VRRSVGASETETEGLVVRAGRLSDVTIGQALKTALYDRAGNLLFCAGGVVTCEKQRDRLLERGFKLAEDASHRDGAGGGTGTYAPIEPAAIHVFDAVRDIATRLQLLHNQLLEDDTLRFATSLTNMASQLDTLAEKDADAALAAVHLCSLEEGLAPRLAHAAVLCRVLAAALALDAEQRLATISAALTYDVALTSISTLLNQQAAPLTPEQRRVVNGHTLAACEMLRNAGVTDEVWLAAVADHHERVDGSGYPKGLSGDSISLPARIIGIVDSFSAMVRPRAYRGAVLSRQALRDLFIERSKSVDARLAHIFVKEVGMYPPGSLVRLTSGEVGIVVRRDGEVAHPQVRLVVNLDGTRSATFPFRDTRQPGLEIVEGVPSDRHHAVLASVHVLWKPT
jgi:HD-GYP domain-containing protein (c-di-GMP phosphodiesterase class II)